MTVPAAPRTPTHRLFSTMNGSLPEPPDAQPDWVWRQLDSQFRTYDRAAMRYRLTYQTLKVLTLLIGTVVTILAAIKSPAALTASLAAGVVATEGIQQLFQLHANWISYRTAAEALRALAFAHAAQVPPYNDPATRSERLAMAIQSITAAENTAWKRTMEHPAGGST
jgi:hypothetical protein